MKNIITLFVLVFATNALGFDNDKMCLEMAEKVHNDCIEAMCEDAKAEGFECVQDGDFFEGVSVCMDQFYYDVEDFNEKNPETPLNCEDIDFDF